MRIPHDQAIDKSGVLAALSSFDARVAGTPPLGIDTETSDIDVLCTFDDGAAFTDAVVSSFRSMDGFTIRQWRTGKRAIIAQFRTMGWDFEIYGEKTPVEQQDGWRHFCIERRLLQLGGLALRQTIVRQKRAGLKTEPALAHVLQLPGCGYSALLELEGKTDAELRALFKRAHLA